MAVGDEATSEGMDLVAGSTPAHTIDTEINKTRDYIASFFKALKTWADGRFVLKSQVYDWVGSVFNKVASYNGAGNLVVATPTSANHAANKGYVDASTAAVPADPWFNTVGANGPIYTPHGRATPVTSSYVSAWLNGDGRIGASASSRRHKHEIEDYAPPPDLLDLRPVTFRMIEDENQTVRIGLIAEEVNDIEPLLVRHEDGKPEGVHYEFLAVALLAEVQQLSHAVLSLRSQLEGDPE